MAKKSILQREWKRKKLMEKYGFARKELLTQVKKADSFAEKLLLREKLEQFPRNACKIRMRNRCWKTGRSRGYFRVFGVCRNMLRELGLDCFFPGLTKSSW